MLQLKMEEKVEEEKKVKVELKLDDSAEIRPLVPAEVKEENTEEVNGGLLVTIVQSQYNVLQLTSIMYGLQWRVFGVAD